MNTFQKVKFTLLITNIVGVAGAGLFFSWWGLFTAVGVWALMNLSLSAGFHRLFCHNTFKTNKFWEILLLFFGTIASTGSSISWCGQHRLHHAKSDTEGEDPYYPHGKNIFYVWMFAPWDKVIPAKFYVSLLRSKAHKFAHVYYFWLLTAYAGILYLINPELVIWAWALPAAMSFFSLQVTGVLGHIVGEKTYDIDDDSRDSHILNILTFGESYQNSHHHDTSQLIQGKYDISGHLCKYISKATT